MDDNRGAPHVVIHGDMSGFASGRRSTMDDNPKGVLRTCHPWRHVSKSDSPSPSSSKECRALRQRENPWRTCHPWDAERSGASAGSMAASIFQDLRLVPSKSAPRLRCCAVSATKTSKSPSGLRWHISLNRDERSTMDDNPGSHVVIHGDTSGSASGRPPTMDDKGAMDDNRGAARCHPWGHVIHGDTSHRPLPWPPMLRAARLPR